MWYAAMGSAAATCAKSSGVVLDSGAAVAVLISDVPADATRMLFVVAAGDGAAASTAVASASATGSAVAPFVGGRCVVVEVRATVDELQS